MVIRHGPVDEDVPAAGANPFGIPGAGGAADAIELAALLLLALAAVVVGILALPTAVAIALLRLGRGEASDPARRPRPATARPR
jgi:hypothetical protein